MQICILYRQNTITIWQISTLSPRLNKIELYSILEMGHQMKKGIMDIYKIFLMKGSFTIWVPKNEIKTPTFLSVTFLNNNYMEKNWTSKIE